MRWRLTCKVYFVLVPRGCQTLLRDIRLPAGAQTDWLGTFCLSRSCQSAARTKNMPRISSAASSSRSPWPNPGYNQRRRRESQTSNNNSVSHFCIVRIIITTSTTKKQQQTAATAPSYRFKPPTEPKHKPEQRNQKRYPILRRKTHSYPRQHHDD